MIKTSDTLPHIASRGIVFGEFSMIRPVNGITGRNDLVYCAILNRMNKHEVTFSYTVYPDWKDLPENDRLLLEHAARTCQQSYAPYSKFRVAAAIRDTHGQITVGSNQENGAYPVGQCAERVALYSMVHQHGRVPIDSIAICVDSALQKTPASPCGSCRQILNEYRAFQSTPIRLLLSLAGGGEVYEIDDIKDLLPFAFDGLFLGQ